jgi:hypothetical protein
MIPKTCIAAIAALFLAVAPSAGAVAPEQASCQGSITSVQATTGQLQGGSIADDVHRLGQPAFTEFQQHLAHQQPSGDGCDTTP